VHASRVKTQRTVRAGAGTDGGQATGAAGTCTVPMPPPLLRLLMLMLLLLLLILLAGFEQMQQIVRADVGKDGGPTTGAAGTCTVLAACASAAAAAAVVVAVLRLSASDAVGLSMRLVSVACVLVAAASAFVGEGGIAAAAAAAAGCTMVVGSSCRTRLLRLAATAAVLLQRQTWLSLLLRKRLLPLHRLSPASRCHLCPLPLPPPLLLLLLLLGFSAREAEAVGAAAAAAATPAGSVAAVAAFDIGVAAVGTLAAVGAAVSVAARSAAVAVAVAVVVAAVAAAVVARRLGLRFALAAAVLAGVAAAVVLCGLAVAARARPVRVERRSPYQTRATAQETTPNLKPSSRRCRHAPAESLQRQSCAWPSGFPCEKLLLLPDLVLW